MYSLDSYQSLLTLALEQGYHFASFIDDGQTSEKRVYLRHDIDWSPALAVKMAEVNHKLGIRGAFCFQIRSQFYNLYAERTLAAIRAIIDLGQFIGFHYAFPAVIPAEPQALVQLLLADYAAFAREVPETLPLFCWHQTTPEILEWGLNHDVPGLVNAYSRRFFKDMPYYSDSVMRYTVPEWEAIITRGHPAMQLLFHPGIWAGGGSNRAEISAALWRAIIRERDIDPDMQNPTFTRYLPARIPDEALAQIITQTAENSSE
jgi:hypothetical protein